MYVLHTNTDDFKEKVLQSKLPVLVDFWAEWCGPCKMIAPILDEIAKEYEGKIYVVKIDVDKNQSLALEYSVSSIPNLLLFKDGDVADQSIGLIAKENIIQMIDSVLLK